MKITWNESLARARRGFAFSSLGLLLSLPMIGHDSMDSWATFFICLSFVILVASAVIWTVASYHTRQIRVLTWCIKRLIVFFIGAFITGLVIIYRHIPSPGEYSESPGPGALVAIASALGLLGLYIVVEIDKLHNPSRGV